MLNINAFVTNADTSRFRAGLRRGGATTDAANIITVGAMSEAKTFEFESGSEWNPANFEGVMARYQSRIYRFIYSIVGETETANDLTQDTFLSAYRSLCRRYEVSEANGEPPQKPSDNMSAWLYTIARNAAFSEMRRRKVVRFLSFWHRPGNNQDDEFDGMADTPLVEAGGGLEARSALSDQLQRAIDAIGRERLSALLLHIDGFSYKEICQITGDSLPSVKSQIFRAKESLRKTLAAQESSELFNDEQGGRHE